MEKGNRRIFLYEALELRKCGIVLTAIQQDRDLPRRTYQVGLLLFPLPRYLSLSQ